ncbi:MAG: glycoside hydrolase family 43 protein [Pseudomonadota bacterium]
MHIMIRLGLATALAALAACSGGGASAPSTPLPPPVVSAPGPVSSLGDLPDPFVLADAGQYLIYATNGQGRNVQALRSSNLLSWQLLPDVMPQLATWVRKPDSRVWAPEVIKLGNRYALYYTARSAALDKQCVGVAIAAAPEGPFVDQAAQPLVCQGAEGGTIDASPHLVDGRLYLYFKSDGNCCGMPTHLYGQELSADGLGVIGTAVRLLTNGRAWEGAVIEAPTMHVRAGQHYLFYSGNDYGGAAYAVGYALCAGPLGPCTAAADGPFLKSRADAPRLIGPGHQDVFQVGAQDWIAYHAWEELAGGVRGNRRFLYIDKLDWVDGKPVARGPTIVP